MGTIVHETLIITGDTEVSPEPIIHLAYAKGLRPMGPSYSPVNCFWTIVLPSEGSKLGWTNHDAACQARREIIDYLNDMPGYMDFVLVEFGETTPRVIPEQEIKE